MDTKKLIKDIQTLLAKYGETSIIKTDKNNNNSLVINVEETDIGNYKLLVSSFDSYVNICCGFRTKTEFDKNELFKTLNMINQESFLTFTFDKEIIKVDYKLMETSNDDVKKICQILTLIPSEIDEQYANLKKYL